MEKRIATFSNEDLYDLEQDVNDFLENSDGCLHEVIYQHKLISNDIDYSVVLVYTPRKELNEKRK